MNYTAQVWLWTAIYALGNVAVQAAIVALVSPAYSGLLQALFAVIGALIALHDKRVTNAVAMARANKTNNPK